MEILKDKDNVVKNKPIKYCIAAVKYSTIGSVYKNISENKKDIYLITTTDGKTTAYGSCSKTSHETEYCHLHQQMFNRKTLKIFEKDIVSLLSDKSNLKRLANINDPYFENMGKRGAKEKKNINNYTFLNKDDPILKILNHKNQKLSTLLNIYASHLLKNDFTIPIKEIDTNINIPTQSNLLSLMSSVIDNEDANISDTEVSESDISDLEDSEEASVSCIEIKTNNGEILYVNDIDNMVYEVDGELIGILTEISEDFHTIIHENKFYTVLEEKDKLFCCKITGTFFDKELNFISVGKKIGKNKFKLIK